MQNKAVVVGALGVIGRYIVEKLVEAPDWRVAGLSRRKTMDGPRYRHIAVDLLDPEDTKRKLAELTDVTHVFYAAFQATPRSAASFLQHRSKSRDVGELGDRHQSGRASSKTSRACHGYQVLRRAPWAAEDADA